MARQDDYLENDFLDWDDEIQEDGEAYELLEECQADFTVKRFERTYTDSNAPMAVLYIEVKNDEGKKNMVRDYIVLRESTIWKISEFFRSVGMKRHGQKVKMDFQGAVGKTGRCKVIVDKFETKTGHKGVNNKIGKYYDHPSILESPSETIETGKQVETLW